MPSLFSEARLFSACSSFAKEPRLESVSAPPPIESRRASLASRSMSGSRSIFISRDSVVRGLELYIFVWLGEASGDFPGVNFLAGIPRLPRRSERLFRRSTRLLMEPRLRFASGLARP